MRIYHNIDNIVMIYPNVKDGIGTYCRNDIPYFIRSHQNRYMQAEKCF